MTEANKTKYKIGDRMIVTTDGAISRIENRRKVMSFNPRLGNTGEVVSIQRLGRNVKYLIKLDAPNFGQYAFSAAQLRKEVAQP